MNNILIFAGKFVSLVSKTLIYVGLVILSTYLSAKLIEFILTIIIKPNNADGYDTVEASVGILGTLIFAVAAIFFHKKLFPKNQTPEESSSQES